MGERGARSGNFTARDGSVPRAISTLSDQGPRQARGLQAGEKIVIPMRQLFFSPREELSAC